MYSFCLNVLSGNAKIQVGYLSTNKPLKEKQIIEGNVLWENYENRNQFHRIEEIKQIGNEKTYTVMLTVFKKIKKRFYANIASEDMPIAVFLEKTKKKTRKDLADSRVHRNGNRHKRHSYTKA